MSHSTRFTRPSAPLRHALHTALRGDSQPAPQSSRPAACFTDTTASGFSFSTSSGEKDSCALTAFASATAELGPLSFDFLRLLELWRLEGKEVALALKLDARISASVHHLPCTADGRRHPAKI